MSTQAIGAGILNILFFYLLGALAMAIVSTKKVYTTPFMKILIILFLAITSFAPLHAQHSL